jgi:hypothetical protein
MNSFENVWEVGVQWNRNKKAGATCSDCWGRSFNVADKSYILVTGWMDPVTWQAAPGIPEFEICLATINDS